MIDVLKCEYEDRFENEEYTDLYYSIIFPIDNKWFPELDKRTVGMCVCLSVCTDGADKGGYYMQIAPTVELTPGCYTDTDWVDLIEGEDYDEHTVRALLKLAKYDAGLNS